ncbi:DUF4214 domain-containing protein [Tianweitania populi]|uniref:DUF4214 domain-containing protein n=1 Tax=Tianweitania populi TaxID=1607949 RepID=A0A8J3DNX7_9HYPH|nr:DUF4214 domain-containing protein [Tianweitania populi]GHD12791.1 hypothetical protein GCM10016234_17590 [Tianweitania populi]
MATIQGIYIALFGRPADPAGLAYWEAETKGGTDLSGLIGRLTQSDEYLDRFEGQSQEQIVSTIYQALFGREPDAAGLAFFVDALANGTQTIETIAINILDGARNTDATIIENKQAAADLFTASLDTPEEIAAYVGDDAAAVGRAFISQVTADPASVPTQAEVDQAIDQGVVNPPEEPTQPGTGGGGGGTPQPVDTVSTRTGELSLKAQDAGQLFAGSGNSSKNFEITETSLSKIELALKGYHRGVGDVAAAVNGVYHFDGDDKAGFAFSVASLGEKTIEQLIKEGYVFTLKIDNDGGTGFGANSTSLTLQQQTSTTTGEAAQDSGYNWVRTAGNPIFDDEGNNHVTQNIQTPLWYGASAASNGSLQAGEYSVSLEVTKSGQIVANEQITLDVAPYTSKLTATDGVLSPVALKSDGSMLNGTGNSGDEFRVVQIDLNQNGAPDLEIALGGQAQRGRVYAPQDGVIHVADGEVPTFKFSIASLPDNGQPGASLASLLGQYDFRLHIDTNPTAITSFIDLSAKASADSNGAFDWTFDNGSWTDTHNQPVSLTDDAGNTHVSQNVQALGWYQPEGGHLFGPAASDKGLYTVSLEVYEKGSLDLVGSSTLVFDIA